MSLPKNVSSGSKPSCSRTSRRTSMPAVLTASTTRRSSCWPWSYSPRSRPVSRRPVPEIVTPSSSSRRSDGHSRSLGPKIAVSGCSLAAVSSRSRAWGSGEESSWSSQTQSGSDPEDGGIRSRPARTTSPYESRFATWCTSQAPARRRMAAESSREPVSSATNRSGGCVCCSTPARTAGSQRAPLWLTRRTETGTGATLGPGPRPPKPSRPASLGRRTRSDGALLQLAPLTLRQPAPDAEALVVVQCVLEALPADVAGQADPLGLACGATLLREERLRVGLRAQGPLLPPVLLGVVAVEQVELSHGFALRPQDGPEMWPSTC